MPRSRRLVRSFLPKVLRAERKRQGLSTLALAERLRFDRSSLVRWELGDNSPPLNKLERWARELGYEVRLVRSGPMSPAATVDPTP